MARRNLSYNMHLFEQPYYESTAKSLDKEYKSDKGIRRTERKKNIEKDEPKKKSVRSKKKGNMIFNISMGVLFGIVLVILVSSIIIGQVQLTELNQDISDAQKVLEEEQSKFTQLQMKIDGKLSTAVIEKYAQEKLDMQRATNSQKEFVNLSEGDKAEVFIKQEPNIFQRIGEAFSSLWS